MVNTQIRQFKDSIIAITNASPLPIEVKRLVFSEIQTQIMEAANEVIANEGRQAEQEQAQAKEEDNKNEQ